MKTGLITSDTYHNHNTGDGHPEKIDRVTAIIENFKRLDNKNLVWEKPNVFDESLLITTHSSDYIKMVNNIDWSIDNNSINTDFFEKNQNYFENYGRDMEILLLKTTICHSKRVFCLDEKKKTIITKDDLENGFKLFKAYIIENNDKKIFSMYN